MIPDRDILKFDIHVGRLEDMDYPSLMIGVFGGIEHPAGVLERIDRIAGVGLQDLIDLGEIRGSFKEFTIIHLGKEAPFAHVIVMGLGPRDDYCIDSVRSITAKAARTMRKIGILKMAVAPFDFPGDTSAVAEAVTEGTILGLYKFDKYYHKRRPPRRVFQEIKLVLDEAGQERGARAAIEKGESLGWATLTARTMGNEPPNIRTPQALAHEAQKLGKRHGMKVRIFDERDLKHMRMGGILAVGSAGTNPPRLIEMRYARGEKKGINLAFVGKGITFDAGGLSLKSSAGMYRMKYDMSGAAAVLGAMEAIAARKLPVNVIGLVPACENLIDARGYRPGDVIRMYNGKHVEITDTDAEGRLILADALAYANVLGADLIVDLATLTGGIITSLGHVGSGIMGNNQWVIDQIIAAGKACAEKHWHLPLWDEFSVHLKSIVAEMVNCHQSSAASSSSAGLFLKAFVGKTPWAHLDIAGTAWIDEDSTLYYHRSYLPKRGATGVGVRTLAGFTEKVLEMTRGSRQRLEALLDTSS